MAGNPAAAIILLGLGVDSLSMSNGSLLSIKWVIRSFSQQEAKTLTDTALQMEKASSIRALLHKALEDAGTREHKFKASTRESPRSRRV